MPQPILYSLQNVSLRVQQSPIILFLCHSSEIRNRNGIGDESTNLYLFASNQVQTCNFYISKIVLNFEKKRPLSFRDLVALRLARWMQWLMLRETCDLVAMGVIHPHRHQRNPLRNLLSDHLSEHKFQLLEHKLHKKWSDRQ